MDPGIIAKVYRDRETIVREGEVGECMYVIVSGKAEVLGQKGGKEFRLAVLGPTDFFGELAVFDRERRSATVRAVGELRAIAVEKRTFERTVVEDPSLAFRLLEKMSQRIRELDSEVIRLRNERQDQGGKA